MRRSTIWIIALLLLVPGACRDLVTPDRTALPPATSASTTSSYSTDWHEYATGAQPAGWTQMWDPTAYFLVAEDSSATGGKVLQWAASGQSRNRWGLAYDGFGDAADQEVYTEFRVRSLGGGTSVWYMGSAAVRMTGTATNEGGYAVWFVATSTARSLALSTWTGGGYTQLATVPVAWTDDTWYSVRLQAVGATIQARVWPRGTPEPAAWTMSVTNTQWPAGKPGVSHHDNGVVQWDVWQATVFSTPPPPPPPPPPSSTLQFTFSDGTTGTAPGGWTETAYPAGSDWVLAADASASDGRVLRNTTTATARHVLRLDAVPDTTTAQEVLTKMRLGDGDSRGPGVALRHRMSGTSETAYVAYFRPGLDQVEINRFLNGAWAFINARAFVNDPGAWYWMRFRAEGSALKLRVWADGTAEPQAWTLEVTNGEIAAGSLGLYTYEPNTVDYDAFSAAVGGGTAPVPAPPPPAGSLTAVTLSPQTVSLQTAGTAQFSASGTLSDGSSTAVQVTYAATGGTITSAGLYTAGSAAGSFQVVAVEPQSGLADTASVTITAPTLQQVVLTPGTATLDPGATVQFVAAGQWSDGSTTAVQVGYSATGGSITPGGLYTAGSMAGSYQVVAVEPGSGLADTSQVTIDPPPPPPPPGGSQWFTDFSPGTVGSPMPDLRKMRSNWEWNYLLVVRSDPQATGGRILKLEGPGTMNGGSRPHAWLVVPVADEQEVVVKLRASDVTYAAGGAYLSGSIDANNNPQEYGARLSKGRFELWNYRNGGFNRVDVAAPGWVPGQWMWVRLRKTATQVMARYWVDGQPEPAAWTLTQPRNFGANGGATVIPSGRAGLYSNTVQSGVEFDVMGAAVDGATAPTSGTPVVGTFEAPDMPGALVATDFSGDTPGQPPAGWTPTLTTTGVTWNVADLGGGNQGIRSVGTANGNRLLDYTAMSDAATDQEVLLRVKPSTTGSSYTVGAALRIEGAAGGSDSFYAVALGAQALNYIRVVDGVRTVLEGSIKFDYQAGKWYWLRARVQGSTLMGKVWRTDEPEPGSWFKLRTDTGLAAGSAGLYHFFGDSVDLDDLSIRAQ